MRDVYEKLFFSTKAWFSKLLEEPGWFYKEAAEEDVLVEVEIDCTEGQDTCHFEIDVEPEDLVPNRGLGGFLGGNRGAAFLELDATEGQDTAHFDVEVLEALPAPIEAPLVPEPLPEPVEFSPFQLSTGEVPAPVIAVLGSISATEEADKFAAEAELFDWVGYDNEALLAL